MREQGDDRTKGGKAAEARRASLARRRAAGEPIGRAAAKAKREGTYQKPDTPPAPMPAAEQSAAWLASGEAWEQTAARALEKDRGRTLVLAGNGAGLRVEKDALIVTEGYTHYPQSPAVHRLHRAVHGVERIVCLADSGSLTLDALRWCRDQGIALLLLDQDGALVSVMTPELVADVALRRRQYEAAITGRDLDVAKWLIREKIRGQRDTLARFPTLPGAADGVAELDAALASMASPDGARLPNIISVMTFEGRASAAYFASWKGYPLKWKERDRKYIPPHWKEVRERHSPLSDSARRAIDPVNAILNYAYGVLEGQCKRALIAAGFDVACGFLHADRQHRDSLVYDVMELFRPAVDALVLSLLDRTTFTYGDFTRARDGQCRLHPQLTRVTIAGCFVSEGVVAVRATQIRAMLTATP
jgi:CRISPR-associated protein Cas1